GVSAGSSGGVIYNLGGNVSLADSWVMDSFADGDQAIGGAIYNGGGGHLQVEDSTLLNNLVGWSSGSGGAIYNLASDLTLIRADFVENEAHGATGRGGALYNDAEGTVRVDSSLFFRNLARGAVGRGGAIYHGSGTLTSRWSSFSRNQAGGAGGEGGGVWNGSGILVVEDSLFLSNIGGGAGGVGGGVFNLEGVVQIARSKLKFNSSAGAVGRGGAILSQGGDLEISDTELLGNRAEGNGGALYLRGTASCRILRSLCQANIAQGTPGTSRGGGIYLEAGRLFAANTTFSLNEWATGAAIFNEGGEAELVHCTLFNEPATSSLTAIFNESTLRLSNSLVLTTASDLNCANTGTFVDGGGNLVSDGSCPGIPSAVITGFDTALANHGGQTATHALLAGSNAIDAALLTGCGFAGAGSVDQRGAQRGVDGDGAPGSPQVGDCDVGAYEFSAAAPPWRIFSDDFESGDTGSWSDQSSP
ncbi:MAG: hypothetical protein KDD47_26845, partial [Acidobacteria bacterium]|nr:hypothetical protein [Acidobacteriota bacterium]